MYPHHAESLKRAYTYFTEISPLRADIIAVIFGGSVAKGCERPDSDLDFIVLLSDARFAALEAQKTISACVEGYCTYPEGYFDIKYQTKAFLRDVAEKGSEPARNAFLRARCIFTRDDEIPALVERAQRFDVAAKPEKMLSFYAQLLLNMGYYWQMSAAPKDVFLRVHTASEIVLYGLRMLLEEKEVLFPCPKSLYLAVQGLADKPDDILEKADRLLRELSDEAKDDFVSTLLGFLQYRPPEDFSIPYSRYHEDTELWWRNPRPFIAEW